MSILTNTTVTVKLLPRTIIALEDAANIAGLNKTDCINRAIQVYAHLVNEVSIGTQIMCVTSSGAECELTEIFPGKE